MKITYLLTKPVSLLGVEVLERTLKRRFGEFVAYRVKPRVCSQNQLCRAPALSEVNHFDHLLRKE